MVVWGGLALWLREGYDRMGDVSIRIIRMFNRLPKAIRMLSSCWIQVTT